MKRFSSILALAVLALVPVRLGAGWFKIYGGEHHDRGYCVQQTADGGYIVTGYDNRDPYARTRLWLLKTDENGDTLWTRILLKDEYTMGYSVQQTTDGGYIITGYTSRGGSGPSNLWLIKTTEQGDTIWTRTYGDSRGSVGHSVQQTTDGGYIITGYTGRYWGANLWLLKTNSQGDTLWTRSYGGDSFDGGHKVKQSKDQGYFIAGETFSFGTGSRDIWLLRTDSIGDTLWTRTFGGEKLDEVGDIDLTSDGGCILIGTVKYDPDTDASNILVHRVDRNGNTIWSRTYSNEWEKINHGYSIRRTNDEGYIILGGYWVLLIKINGSGETLWTQSYEKLGNCVCIQQTDDGGYIMTGSTQFLHPGNNDLLLVKTDSLGYISISEQPVAGVERWQLLSPIGSRVVVRYADMQEGFHAVVYNAAGQKVDEVHSTLTSGTVSWGEGFLPGVYFIVPETQGAVRAQKVVLIR